MEKGFNIVATLFCKELANIVLSVLLIHDKLFSKSDFDIVWMDVFKKKM